MPAAAAQGQLGVAQRAVEDSADLAAPAGDLIAPRLDNQLPHAGDSLAHARRCPPLLDHAA